MDGRGPRRQVGGPAAAGTGAAQPGLTQPAPQAATGRQGGVREVPCQDQADQLGPPVRVLLAQGPGLHDEGRGGVRAGGRPVVGRLRDRSAVVAPQAEQVVDSAQGQAEALGQGGRGQAALVAEEYGLTNRRWNGAWHGSKP